MTSPLQSAIHSVRRNQNLSQDHAREIVLTIMQGTAADDEIASFLLAMREKGETEEELAGAAAALRELMLKIGTSRTRIVDTCGTGGDGLGTFNISTASALVTAAAGLPVAKHGNRGVSSRSGSADVLKALGVHIDAPLAVVRRCLDELGICFCFAPLWHSSVRNVAQVRARLGVPTLFNWLGPLCNPANAEFQLMGVGHAALRTRQAQALHRLGTHRSAVVCGQDGLDEVSLSGPTSVSLVTSQGLEEQEWTPEQFGISRSPLDGLRVSGVAESAATIRGVLQGGEGPTRDVVLLNSAAALWIASPSADFSQCRRAAETAVDSGAALDLLGRLGELSHAPE